MILNGSLHDDPDLTYLLLGFTGEVNRDWVRIAVETALQGYNGLTHRGTCRKFIILEEY
jgi:hypothetical protein